MPTIEDLRNWLQNNPQEVEQAINGGLQYAPQQMPETYRFPWSGGMVVDGITYPLRANLHHGGEYDGGLGSVWANGIEGGINAQDNPLLQMFQNRCRQLANEIFHTAYPVGDGPVEAVEEAAAEGAEAMQEALAEAAEVAEVEVAEVAAAAAEAAEVVEVDEVMNVAANELVGARAVTATGPRVARPAPVPARRKVLPVGIRSEEHTSELQSPLNLVCRLLLEKK